ncbi:glycosyltransferase family 2 protein [Pseudomonas silesiensis]
MKVSLIVPVFNEEKAIEAFYQAVRQAPDLREYQVEIVFIDDGSAEGTSDLIQGIALDDSDVILINFSRNFGKEPALLAGLDYASGDVIIPMDVDLQDPIDVIPRLIAEWKNGAEVVLAKLPLRVWSYVGGAISLVALACAAYMLLDKLLYGNEVPGFPSLITAILFLGGVQLVGIGVMGEYIGRIYMETKHRPRYVVRSVLKGDAPRNEHTRLERTVQT